MRLEEGSDIWLFGGAEVVRSCLKEQLIDQFIIGIISTILSEGISLFGNLPSEQKLMLVESTVTDDIVFLRYDIRK
ncbi:dihydrofolate reductase family protein [Streptococcus suis]|nr:dihydrofolate reductase family protein [Streptococcus suis]